MTTAGDTDGYRTVHRRRKKRPPVVGTAAVDATNDVTIAGVAPPPKYRDFRVWRFGPTVTEDHVKDWLSSRNVPTVSCKKIPNPTDHNYFTAFHVRVLKEHNAAMWNKANWPAYVNVSQYRAFHQRNGDLQQ